MSKQVMRRNAADNEYLHKDFHGALSAGLIYLQREYGEDAVKEYLRRFARRFLAPVKAEIEKRGLEAVADRLRRIYELEDADVSMEVDRDELMVEVKACPAVEHMREHGYEVSPLWHETIRAVHETLCECSPFRFELVDYEPESGASRQRFYRPSARTGGGDAE